MIYEQPVVLRWGSPREFLQLFVSNKADVRASEDWRVRKLRSLIDSDPARAQWSLDEVCQQLELSFRPASAKAFQSVHRSGNQGICKKEAPGSRSPTIADHG